MEKNNFEINESSNCRERLINLDQKSKKIVADNLVLSAQIRIQKGLTEYKKLLEEQFMSFLNPHENKMIDFSLSVIYIENSKKFRLISNNINGKHILNMDLDLVGLENTLNILEDMFLSGVSYFGDNVNNVILQGGEDHRGIFKRGLLGGKGEKIHYVGQDSFGKSKEKLIAKNNETEELFKFYMKTRGIPVEDWGVFGVIEGDVNNESKMTIGFNDTNNIDSSIKLASTD